MKKLEAINRVTQPAWAIDNPYLHILKGRFFSHANQADWSELPQRVQRLFLGVERLHAPEAEAQRTSTQILALVQDGAFLPNSPVMMNSEREDQVNLFACHVLAPPVGIDELEVAKIIHDGCGGIGYDLTALPDPVALTQTIEQQTALLNPTRKRKAHSAVTLSADHPQFKSFIELGDRLSITHTNVELDESFFQKLEASDPHTIERWDLICHSITETGKPAIAFGEHKARRSPNGERLILNVCGESLLRENESSLIGSLNLSRFVSAKTFDTGRFVTAVHLGVRCLDNFHDLQRHASPLVAKRCAQSRKIGLGVMGYADALLLLGLRYGSPEALAFARTVMTLLSENARAASEGLAAERGTCDPQLQPRDGSRPRRNASLMAVAANGTLSLLANATGGIEPVFSYLIRQEVEGVVVHQLQPTLRRLLCEQGFDETALAEVVEALLHGAQAHSLDVIPRHIRGTLVRAHDLTTAEHIQTQATFQAFIDGGISKTINLPSSSTRRDVANAILKARASGCVGVSLYRDGSIAGQPSQRPQMLPAKAAMA
ncbi:Vitamin B12-dependent ribonucleoside-diphosphate reductase [Paraburkholderia ultramafica]|uniref:Vitamin B12-dependent ribonucleoside-diphosphate reductase n=1 Tax=Paraburkholderia ultramafica TaxID=1544867 RepID=A0A6S7B2S4_9BURK|nr:hypothetical protein [Paraburkholderia ultramafica]CAB3785932.1 Vitamin B12-dependent ribonucleoside-diphosphate reductase [Paraburkholderia ultramafica]